MPNEYENVTKREWVEYEFATIEYDYQIHHEAARIIRLLFDELVIQTIKVKWGFKSKNQLRLFMIWREYWVGENVEYVEVIFNSYDWIRL